MRKILLSVFCLTVALTGHSQLDLKFQTISIKDGLSSNSINDIVKDVNGFIWVATDDGLNRYDGKEIRVYHHDDFSSGGLPAVPMCGRLASTGEGLWRSGLSPRFGFRRSRAQPSCVACYAALWCPCRDLRLGLRPLGLAVRRRGHREASAARSWLSSRALGSWWPMMRTQVSCTSASPYGP